MTPVQIQNLDRTRFSADSRRLEGVTTYMALPSQRRLGSWNTPIDTFNKSGQNSRHTPSTKKGFRGRNMKLTGKKFLLLILYTPTKNGKDAPANVPITGRTRLMKMSFLFDKEVREDFIKDKTFSEVALPEFFPWKYGPFSRDLLNDLEFLVNQQYIAVAIARSVPNPEELAEYEYWVDDLEEYEGREYQEEEFSLTPDAGIPKAQEIWSLLSANQRHLLIQFKALINQAPLDRILEYVYKKYKDQGYADKSLIREKYLS